MLALSRQDGQGIKYYDRDGNLLVHVVVGRFNGPRVIILSDCGDDIRIVRDELPQPGEEGNHAPRN